MRYKQPIKSNEALQINASTIAAISAAQLRPQILKPLPLTTTALDILRTHPFGNEFSYENPKVFFFENFVLGFLKNSTHLQKANGNLRDTLRQFRQTPVSHVVQFEMRQQLPRDQWVDGGKLRYEVLVRTKIIRFQTAKRDDTLGGFLIRP